MPDPCPPPEGWSLPEAAAALCPDEWRAASESGRNTWMAGPGDWKRAEREALRLAFARIMERGDYAAEGFPRGATAPALIPATLWRAALVFFGLPGQARILGDVVVPGGDYWRGVRVMRADATAKAQSGQPDTITTAAHDWMQTNVTRRGAWKRESAIDACRKDVRCSYRVALAAWNALPDDLRGARGTPKPKSK